MYFAKVPHCFMDDLPKDRPFTRLEAAFQFEVDRFNSKERSMREYSKIWSWSPNKVIRFVEEMFKNNIDDSLSFSIKTDGTEAEQTRNSSGTLKELKNKELQGTTEQTRNSDGTEAEHVYIKKRKEKEDSSLFTLWNEVVSGSPLPTVKTFNKSRQSKCITRMKERSFEEWKEVFRLMVASQFLCGGADGTGWKAGFDWIIKKDENSEKVLEGAYQQKAGGRVVSNGNRYSMFAGA
jgi:hypothetical protein